MIRFFYLLGVFVWVGFVAKAEPRLAVVIGNEAYPPEVGALSNPHEDAGKVAQALESVGFEIIGGVREDADRTEIWNAILALQRALKAAGPDAVGFVYYSGHGASFETGGLRSNYFVPSNAPIVGANQLPALGVSLKEVVGTLDQAGAKAVFVVTDACRNTLPFISDRGGAQPDKSFVVQPAASGMLLAYSTADGETAPDDGVFAQELAEHLTTPGLTADRMFTLLGREVAKRRSSQRFPVVSDRLGEDFCFLGCAGPETTVRSAVILSEASDEGDALATAITDGTLAAYIAFAEAYPESSSRDFVNAKIRDLSASETGVIPANEKAAIVEVALRQTLSQPACNDNPSTHTNECAIKSAAFSPDGKQFITGVAAAEAPVVLWDVATGGALQEFGPLPGRAYAIAFSPDGQYIAAATRNDQNHDVVFVWEADTGEVHETLVGHENYILSLAFAPDSKSIATGSWDRTIRVWGIETGTLRQILSGHSNVVNAVTFSPDGARLASGSNDGTVILWDPRTGVELMSLPGVDGEFYQIQSIAFSPDGKALAAGTSAREEIKMWDSESGAVLASLDGHSGRTETLTFSPDGHFLISGARDDTAKLWSLPSGDMAFSLSGHQDAVNVVRMSPDGSTVLTGSADGTAKLWGLVLEER